MNFYWGNIVASGPGIYTREGEDALSVEYDATFYDGKLTEITEVRNTRERAAKFTPTTFYETETPEERRLSKERSQEKLIGTKAYIWWGGREEGCEVTVVYENTQSWVTEAADGKLEIISRWQRGATFFASYEEGKAVRDREGARWEERRRAFEEEIGRPR